MSKDQKIDYAIELIERADDMMGSALRMIGGMNPLASEHIVEAQGQCLDAITHMQTRPLKKLKRGLTDSKKSVY